MLCCLNTYLFSNKISINKLCNLFIFAGKITALINTDAYSRITEELSARQVTLVAVSKTKPVEDIQALYDFGQRDFGENYVQELVEKQALLPPDIRWHFIGHLQSNKVKYIAPFVYLIHSIDNEKLLKEVNKQAIKNNLTINCLLQVHIAEEETKFGMDEKETELLMSKMNAASTDLKNVCVKGLMGMASNTDDNGKVRNEFQQLQQLYSRLSSSSDTTCPFSILSMGMSGDYRMAVEEGSNMVRIGSLLFGAR